MRKLSWSISNALKHADKEDRKLAKSVAREAQINLRGTKQSVIESDTLRNMVIHLLKKHGEHQGAEAYEMAFLHMDDLPIMHVVKRSGRHEVFHPHKLFKSIKKSFADAGEKNQKFAELLTKEIMSELTKTHETHTIPAAKIRETTIVFLRNHRLRKVERSYLLHKYL
mgnify:CR=1 FL=1